MRPPLCLVLLPLLAGPACAAPSIVIPPAIRQSAAVCLAEALRLCPGALTARDHGVSCIVGKRRLLGATCRGLVAQGLNLLGGRDVHLDLRPPKRF